MKRNYFVLYSFIFLFSICQNYTAYGQHNKAKPFPDRIVLNLAEDASTSIAVTWRTDLQVSEGFCELQSITPSRIDPSNTQSYKAKTTRVKYEYDGEHTIDAHQHSFVFTDLEPGKKYLYRVGKDNLWSEWLEFEMPVDDKNEFSFIYFGDPQSNIKSEWSRVIRKAYSVSPNTSFMLYGGDIINRAGRDLEWEEWFVAGSYIYGMVPQVLTPGNHDYKGLELDPHWKYQFTQPSNGPELVKNTCYFSDYKNLKIISIDSATEHELSNENGEALRKQKVWIDSVLTANTKDWVIVTTHLPFYSSKETRDNPLMRKHFQPILEKHGVDIVLTGHDHSYGRGTASDFTSEPSVVYVVSVSGPKLSGTSDKEWMQVKGSNIQLFQDISIENNRLHYKAYTADGELFDEFKIEKNVNGESEFIELNTKSNSF